jgi:hypothetical protein
MNEKILIAKWEEGCSGERYTLFITPNSLRSECFRVIDSLGDPCGVKYKLFDLDYLMEEGMETQDDIADLYEESEEGVEHSFDRSISSEELVRLHTEDVE